MFHDTFFYCFYLKALPHTTNSEFDDKKGKHVIKTFSPLIIIKLFAIIFISLTLSSCSGNYTFESNVKAEGAEQYFSASKVQIYTDESEFTSPYQYIGSVEGDDCQTDSHLAAPDPINARTKARQLAHKMNANAVIFTACVDVENPFCSAQIVCYAKAYQVSEVSDDSK